MADYEIANIKRVAVDTTGRTLVALMGNRLDPGVEHVSVINNGAVDIYHDFGAVNTANPTVGSPASPMLGSGDSATFDAVRITAEKLTFATASGTGYMNVMQKGG